MCKRDLDLQLKASGKKYVHILDDVNYLAN